MNNSKSVFIPLVLSLVFFVSVFDMPYGFYTFARITAFVLSLIFIVICYYQNESFSAILIPPIIIAILWNPIMPIYLDKETWVILDLLAVITESVLGVYAYRLSKNEQ